MTLAWALVALITFGMAVWFSVETAEPFVAIFVAIVLITTLIVNLT